MTAKISSKAKLGKNVSVGDFTVIHDDVVLGDDVTIGSHCAIGLPAGAAKGRPLVIGERSTVRSHSIVYQGSTLGPGLQTGHGVIIRELTEAGPGLQAGSQTDIEGHCTLGRYVKLHSDVHVAQGSRIGNFVYMHPRVQFTNDPFPPSFIEKGVTVHDMAVIATGTLLFPGITIGLGSFVAAGSQVKHDVPDVTCVAGIPARFFARIDKFFLPEHGLYHPWIKRFREKYPADCQAEIDEVLKRINAALNVNR
jgi:acetyltransferase-like isoleucine patch superfamily enzyme